MAGLINIGLSGVLAHQRALNTTGNNITNANTPGYNRQQVTFGSSPGINTADGSIGTGVSITNIRRITSEFITNQMRADTSLFKEQDALLTELTRLDNLLGGEATGLSGVLNNFFSSLQSAAEDPAAIPQRQLVMAEAQSLVTRFQSMNAQFIQQRQSVDQQLGNSISEINALAEGIARLNVAISESPGLAQGKDPNGLLDQRDEKLRELSELVQVSVIPQGGGQVNVVIGNGQALVVGDQASRLTMQTSNTDPLKVDLSLVISGRSVVVTEQINGGNIGGLLHFRENMLAPAQSELNRIALAVSEEVNRQHKLGMDLDGRLGGDFFSDINERGFMLGRVFADANNEPPRNQVLGVRITDTSLLTSDRYSLELRGPTDNDYVLRDVETGKIVQEGRIEPTRPAEISMPGFSIFLESGTFKQGDKFQIRPTENAAANMQLRIDREERLAFAAPVQAEADLGNTGSGRISQGTLFDVTNPLTNKTLDQYSDPGQLTPPLMVRFLSETTYEILDASDPANPRPLNPPLNSQTFRPGVTNALFTPDSGETLVRMTGDALNIIGGAGGNGYDAQSITVRRVDPQTGQTVQQTLNIAANTPASDAARQLSALAGVSANAYTQASLGGLTANGAGDINLAVNGEVINLTGLAPGALDGDSLDALVDQLNSNPTLQGQGVLAETDGERILLRSSTGADLAFTMTAGNGQVTKVSPYVSSGDVGPLALDAGNPRTVGGYLDVTLSDGVSLVADNDSLFNQAPVADSNYRGFQFEINGRPAAGDIFTIGYNAEGTSDNRNAQLLAGLGNKQTMNKGGTATFSEAYGGVVEKVGVRTRQSQLDQSASKVLLEQTTAQRDSTSGVNLDEEAGNLIRFQAAYNASAKVMSVAQELFTTLLNTFR